MKSRFYDRRTHINSSAISELPAEKNCFNAFFPIYEKKAFSRIKQRKCAFAWQGRCVIPIVQKYDKDRGDSLRRVAKWNALHDT